MRIFVGEAVCARLFDSAPSPCLVREGSAMLRALFADWQAVPGLTVTTVVDPLLCPGLTAEANGHVISIDSPATAGAEWSKAIAASDLALLVAPETHGCLPGWLDLARQLMPPTIINLPTPWRLLNATPAACRLCADKWRLGQWMVDRQIAAPRADMVDWDHPPDCAGGLVIKPVDGAGSWLVRRVLSVADWNSVAAEYAAAGRPPAIVQPFITGQALSVAAVSAGPGQLWCGPVAEQHFVEEGSFEYTGGLIPAPGVSEKLESEVHALVSRIVAAMPGLRGYLGFDFVLPDTGAPLQLIEINPRLTTSYLGLRQLVRGSVWNWLIDPLRVDRPDWRGAKAVQFTADGITTP